MNDVREMLARAMRAQGKVDPADVFAKVDAEPEGLGRCVECGRLLTTEEAIRSDACLSCDPPRIEQAPLPIEERGLDWEP